MQLVKINGIRLCRNHAQVSHNRFNFPGSGVPVYRALGNNKINIPFLVFSAVENHRYMSVAVDRNHFGLSNSPESAGYDASDIVILSIFPHQYSVVILIKLLQAVGELKPAFAYLASSNAMLTLTLPEKKCNAMFDSLEKNFDLRRATLQEDLANLDELQTFIRKKYSETRASWVEQKIKTYGICHTEHLDLLLMETDLDSLPGLSSGFLSAGPGKFEYVSAAMLSPNRLKLSLLYQGKTGAKDRIPFVSGSFPAELLHFYGPHFGDRHSIIYRALDCLSANNIPVLQTGCTGASISIILPEGQGNRAKQSLTDVFDLPE